MVTRYAACVGLVIAASLAAADDTHKLLVQPTKLFAVESVTVVKAKDVKQKVLLELTKFDKPGVLPGEGPFDVLVKPKGGIPVRVAANLTIQGGETFEVKLADELGSVEVLGDDLPRAEKVVLTDVKDPGPGEKGHVAVQWGKGYREELVVPPGAYAVWVVPANGARAVRVADNVRVQAGRSTRVGG